MQANYRNALDKVMSLADFERSTHSPEHAKFHLERMSLLLQQLGDPHLGRRTVHVAGTKGKGSTSAMITSILAASGYSVGFYTSPHLHRTVERIRVGLDPISTEEFAHLVEEVWPATEWTGEHGGYGGVTTFEILTAMAFVHFRQAQLEFQVMEVGLGGRLDATNVVAPDVCVITSISLDHTSTLGETIPEIAWEKAGIIKHGVPVVAAPQVAQALGVIRDVARQKHAQLIDVARRLSWQSRASGPEGQSFTLQGLRGEYQLTMPLIGDHQLENAAASVAAAETLNELGHHVNAESITAGIRDVRWEGRLQILKSGPPTLVVDGAHNPYSVRRLAEAIKSTFEYSRVLVVFGGLMGHSIEGMLDELRALQPEIIAVKSRHPRSAPSAIISNAAKELGLSVVFETDQMVDGLRKAAELADETSLILGTGSLFVAAEITEAVTGIEPEVYENIVPPRWEDRRTGP